MLRLGLFREFKGFETVVLLDADEVGLEELIETVARVSAGSASVAVHNIAMLSSSHSVDLYISRDAIPSDADAFQLLVVGEDSRTVLEKLAALRRGPGHQYFDLNPAEATLMVCRGEYDEAWWHRVDS